MASIHFDYRKAISQASDLDDISDDLKYTVVKQLEEIEAGLKRSWEGEASGIFIKKCRELMDKLLLESRSVAETARALREAARILKEAEEEAQRILSD